MRGVAWPDEDLERIIAMKTSGASAAEIARAFTGRSRKSVHRMCEKLRAKDRLPANLPVPQRPYQHNWLKRACLMCHRPFVSVGAGNRVCTACKATKAWTEGAL